MFEPDQPIPTSNILAAIASFIIPGLGQLFQGRVKAALLFLLGTMVAWLVFLGWIIHLWAAFDALFNVKQPK